MASGLHRVLKVTRGTPAALSGVIKAGDTLNRIDSVVLKDAQSEAVMVLIAGPLGSEVELEFPIANGTPRVIRLGRVVLCVNTVSWARALLPLRLPRLESVEFSKVLSETERVERDGLVAGEACYIKIRGKLVAAGH